MAFTTMLPAKVVPVTSEWIVDVLTVDVVVCKPVRTTQVHLVSSLYIIILIMYYPMNQVYFIGTGVKINDW